MQIGRRRDLMEQREDKVAGDLVRLPTADHTYMAARLRLEYVFDSHGWKWGRVDRGRDLQVCRCLYDPLALSLKTALPC